MKARPSWRKKRLLLPVSAVVLILLAAGIGWFRSRMSRLVFYNETGEWITALRVTACRQSRSFGGIRDQESVRWTLENRGAGSEIAVEAQLGGDRVLKWRGGYVEPDAGHRVVLRAWSASDVDVDVQVSIWQQLLGSASVSSPAAGAVE